MSWSTVPISPAPRVTLEMTESGWRKKGELLRGELDNRAILVDAEGRQWELWLMTLERETTDDRGTYTVLALAARYEGSRIDPRRLRSPAVNVFTVTVEGGGEPQMRHVAIGILREHLSSRLKLMLLMYKLIGWGFILVGLIFVIYGTSLLTGFLAGSAEDKTAPGVNATNLILLGGGAFALVFGIVLARLRHPPLIPKDE